MPNSQSTQDDDDDAMLDLVADLVAATNMAQDMSQDPEIRALAAHAQCITADKVKRIIGHE
jgi:hypothetical protein